jgi:hypothetical protein
MEFDFPFTDKTDDELEEHIAYSIKDIYQMVQNRDFEYIEFTGITLVELELERDIRKRGRH